MSNKIKRIIYSKTPIDNVNCVINICTPGAGLKNFNNYLVFDRNFIYSAMDEGFYNIILQYVYNKGIICITDCNIHSETVVIHGEALLYNLVKKNESVTKYFVNNNELEIVINDKDRTDAIDKLIYELKYN